MKKFIQTQIVITVVTFLFLSLSSFGSGKSDSLYCIEIDGKVIIPKNDDNKLYRIELLCHNDVVDSGVVVDNESFLLKVKKNSWYTIRIVKEGYFPLVVSINTNLPEFNSKSHKFHFDTELINNTTVVTDQEAIDFPIAIISFDKRKDIFLPLYEYSKNIRSSLFDIQTPVDGYVKK